MTKRSATRVLLNTLRGAADATATAAGTGRAGAGRAGPAAGAATTRARRLKAMVSIATRAATVSARPAIAMRKIVLWMLPVAATAASVAVSSTAKRTSIRFLRPGPALRTRGVSGAAGCSGRFSLAAGGADWGAAKPMEELLSLSVCRFFMVCVELSGL